MAYKKRKYVRKTVKRKYKKSSLRKQLVRMAESKAMSYEATAAGLLSGSIYSFCPTQLIVQGVTAEQRIGDSVYLQSLQILGDFSAPATAICSLRYRFMVIWSEIGTANATFVTGIIPVTSIALQNTGTNPVNSIVNNRSITVLADTIIDLNSTTTTSQDVKTFSMKIPLNTNFQYAPRLSTVGKNKNLFFVVMPYKVDATVPNAGQIRFAATLKFKDL